MSSVNKDHFTPSFPIQVLYIPSCLTALHWPALSTMLSRRDENRYLGGNIQVLQFSGRVFVEWYYFFFKFLIKFTSDQAWSFLCGKVFNYKLSSFNKQRAIQVSVLFCFSVFYLTCFHSQLNYLLSSAYFGLNLLLLFWLLKVEIEAIDLSCFFFPNIDIQYCKCLPKYCFKLSAQISMCGVLIFILLKVFSQFIL